MKILAFTQILVMGFYGYIGKYQWDRNWSKLIKMLGKTLKKNERNDNTHIEVVLLKKVIYTYKTICYIHQ